jgi:hypothetical protein
MQISSGFMVPALELAASAGTGVREISFEIG